MLFFYSPCDPLYLQDRSINSLSFEDDLVIFSGSQKGLQTVLNKLDNYCSKWQLTTIKKQKIIVFQRNNSPFSEFFYKNQPLTVTHEYHFLGNIIDNKGNFKKAIQELSTKRAKSTVCSKKIYVKFC
jgi:hypothetical protein